MADVATKCISANGVYGGRVITRIPNSRIFYIEPKIQEQFTTAQLDAKYDNRFQHRAYYYDIDAT